jgi:hypothetical protein
LGLAKSQEYLAGEEMRRLHQALVKAGQAARFPKGHVPANKGIRRPGWAPGRMGETQFKKGRMSGKAAQNHKPVGTILADTDGYLRIKIRERRPGDAPGWNKEIWPALHHQIWEQHKGPIPPKHIVAFKDHDRQHCTIDNLELISLADNARRNRMWGRFPRELAEAIHMNGQLKRKLRNLDAKK